FFSRMTFLFDSPYSPPSNPHAHNTIRTMIKLDTYLNRTHHHLQLPFESLAYIALLMLLFQDSSVQALHQYGRKNNGVQALPFSNAPTLLQHTRALPVQYCVVINQLIAVPLSLS